MKDILSFAPPPSCLRTWYHPLTDPVKKAGDDLLLTKLCRRWRAKETGQEPLPGRSREAW